MNDRLQRAYADLYYEYLSLRPSPPVTTLDGPSVVVMQLEREQARWAAIHEVTRTVEAERRSA